MRFILQLTLLAVFNGICQGSPQKFSDRRRSGCPSLRALPIVYEENNTFIGARIYKDKGHEITALACNGQFEDIPAGTYRTLEPDFNCSDFGRDFGSLYVRCIKKYKWYSIGSLLVHDGCQIHYFNLPYWEGRRVSHTGPLVLPDAGISYRSFIVECMHHMPNCTPSDTWATVGSFDNSQSPLDSDYSFEYSVGTSWSEEIKQAFSISTSVNATLRTGFFKMFTAALKLSVKTGYDWSKISSRSKHEKYSIKTVTTVPGGAKLEILQAKGICGSIEIQTERIRNIVTFPNGEKKVNDMTL